MAALFLGTCSPVLTTIQFPARLDDITYTQAITYTTSCIASHQQPAPKKIFRQHLTPQAIQLSSDAAGKA